jgi:hypothetical protein
VASGDPRRWTGSDRSAEERVETMINAESDGEFQTLFLHSALFCPQRYFALSVRLQSFLNDDIRVACHLLPASALLHPSREAKASGLSSQWHLIQGICEAKHVHLSNYFFAWEKGSVYSMCRFSKPRRSLIDRDQTHNC